MKTTGVIILVIGLVMSLYTGFTYVTKERVADPGGIEITADKSHRVDWQPYVGIGTMVIGGVMPILGRKKLVIP